MGMFYTAAWLEPRRTQQRQTPRRREYLTPDEIDKLLQPSAKAGLLHVARLENGIASTHPIRGPELRALRKLRRQYPACPSLSTRTCCGTHAATSSPTTTRTRARSSTTSAPKHHAHGALHRALARAVQGVLEGLDIMA